MKRLIKKFKGNIKYILSGAIAIVLIINSSAGIVLANEDTIANERVDFLSELVDYLSIHARYENVDQESLYKGGLLGVLEEHPELYESVMKNVLESIDEHSEYYNSEDTLLIREQITGTIVGIGITFQMCPDGADVRSVIPDTPAAKAGIEVGDVIVSANDILLSGMNSDTVASHIRGEEGSSLRIGVKRKNIKDIIYFDMTREKITGTSVESKIFEDGTEKLMYIAVYGFVTNTAECFKEALEEAAGKGIKNLVIDVRDNGGGMFDQVIQMADYLLPKDRIITIEDHKIKFLNYVYQSTVEPVGDFDIVVLMNENSASASEVLAAALSENECATLIGKQSYGKGTIQTMVDMVYGDSIKYTVGYYLTPNGNNINGVGLMPDAVVENTSTPFDMSKYSEFSYEKVYKQGDEGDEIRIAKELLKAWGAYNGEINNLFDKELENAVYLFQTATELYPYGVLDLTTQKQIYTRLEKSKVINDDQLDAAFAYFGMERK